eukprot:TRINITY_DN3240_c0_g1_i8.p1 TRINITY_DN3240_c0_g1~~TRINITY_DN3240_c0_g1_i8.p1  ORF type:complete len:384 (+),score=96.80 TRINITY_DN3240_c0_g1_i8:238-1389(+)
MTTQFIPRPVHLMLIWDLSAGPARNPKAVPEPVLPGEILDYLSKGKKDLQYAEYSEAALRRLAGLELDSRFETSKDVISRLLRHLLAVEVMDSTKELRYQGLCKLSCKFPKEASAFLIEQLPSNSLTVSDRILLLRVIRDVSLALSEAKVSFMNSSKSSSAPKKAMKRPQVSKSRQQSAQLIAERIQSKTRICGQKKLQISGGGGSTKLVQVNKFMDIAGHFFFPILPHVAAICRGFSEALLLSQVILTLASVLESAFNALAPHEITRRMSRELWELLNAVKLNKNPLVRRNCVFALSRILLVLPDYVLSEEFGGNELEEVISWLMMTASSDPDEICKDCSIMCVKTLSDIFKVNNSSESAALATPSIAAATKGTAGNVIRMK